MRYNWQQNDWPNFTFDTSQMEENLFDYTQRIGRSSGLIEGLSKEERRETLIEVMVSEAIKTSEIEGEYLNRQDVVSSVKKNLGFIAEPVQVKDQKAKGAADLMTSVREQFALPLTEKMLFAWHKKIMKGSSGVAVGQWRTHDEPMQVVSGAMGKEVVHFEAPPSDRIPAEMKYFMKWFNNSLQMDYRSLSQSPIRAGIAHAYFESIHPFEDGNGRIGRAISEKALSQGAGQPILLSLSRTIEARKNEYYESLKQAQRSNDLTEWLKYFVEVIVQSQRDTEDYIEFTLKKAKFFDQHKETLNDRQTKVIKRMNDEGSDGFEGGMSAKKYMAIAKTSKATATRDIQELVKNGIFVAAGGGRSVKYELKLD